MRILVIGGTAFTGPHVVRQLVREGHEVTLFHRGQTDAKLPKAVQRILGDRREWENYKDELRKVEPELVLDKWKDLFYIYLTLDVIGNQAGTDQNLAILENEYNLSPLPVVTFERGGNDYKQVEGMIERYPFIALGGMVPFMGSPKVVLPHIIKCHQLGKGKTVFHGLGCTNWLINSSVPWYSVDSSSWGASFRYGSVRLFDERRAKWQGFQLGKVHKKGFGHGELFREYDHNIEDFARRELNTRVALGGISARSVIRAERYLRRRFGSVRVPRGDQYPEPGFKCYLVDAAENNLIMVADANKAENARLLKKVASA